VGGNEKRGGQSLLMPLEMWPNHSFFSLSEEQQKNTLLFLSLMQKLALSGLPANTIHIDERT